MAPAVDSKCAGRLIAILLITRSRPGPKLVFHYPAKPFVIPTPPTDSDASEDDSESDQDADSDGPAACPPLSAGGGLDTTGGSETLRTGSNEIKPNGSGPPANRVLGYSVDSLEKLLSPGRWSDSKKFEVTLDDTTFVGHPIYAGEDGEWSSRPRDERHKICLSQDNPSASNHSIDAAEQEADANAAHITITAPDTPARHSHDYTHIPESLDFQQGPSLGTSMDSTSTASGMPAEQMAMFHVVFALSGDGPQSYAVETYQHVAKKLSKALHYCQKQSDYVSTESRKLLVLKAKARQSNASLDVTWKQLEESSELAWALKEVHEKLSVGEVAGIRLKGMELSLHTPQTDAITATSGLTVNTHSALLLLEDKDVLLRELCHPKASPLAHFIREHTPTKSLQKHAANLNFPLIDVLHMSQHLIKWQKARAITPLHARNNYVVRPDAPIEKVAELSQTYARRFAALPTLLQMLKVLSGKPIQYGLLIPSKDHRTPYMEILAFLERYGFVAQLKSFGWLGVGERESMSGDSIEHQAKQERPVSGISLLSPHLRPADDDGSSIASGQTIVTTVPVGGDERRSDTALADGAFILNPQDPTQDETHALQRLNASLADSELREYLPQLLPYFDGEHVLEEIAARESLKRATVKEWLDVLQREGHLVIFRAL